MKLRLLVLVAVSFALVACGDDDDNGESSSPTTSAEQPVEEQPSEDPVDPEGVMRIAYDLVGAAKGGFYWDPSANQTTISDLTLYQWVYGSLMRRAPGGGLEPDLATRAEVIDPTTIEVEIRDGVVMPDGSTLDAAQVQGMLEANRTKQGETLAFRDDFFKLAAIEAVDPMVLRLTIPDGTAASWFDTFLADVETIPVPEGTDFSQPTGAGPLRVARYTPEASATLERNPDYWDADAVRVAAVELVHAPDATAGVSALRAGQADYTRIESSLVDAVEGSQEVISVADPSQLVNFGICKEEPPLADPRVRQALNYAIDREAINDALFRGLGTPAWSLWPADHPLHPEDLTEHYAHDPAGAEELLAEAGFGDKFSFDVLVIGVGGMPELAEVVQQQLADVGVQMNIIVSPNYVEDRANRRAPVGLVPLMTAGRGKLLQWTGDTVANWCQYSDPELERLADELDTVSSDSDEAAELWREVQDKVVRDDALSILVLFQPQLAAYDDERLGGMELVPEPIPLPELRSVFVRR